MKLFDKIFNRPTPEDLGCLHSFERIYKLAPKRYIIRNCSEGFMELMKKSNIPCTISFNRGTVEVLNYKARYELAYGVESFTRELSSLLREGQY